MLGELTKRQILRFNELKIKQLSRKKRKFTNLNLGYFT